MYEVACTVYQWLPRPLGSAVHGTKPNEAIHFDFLSLHESEHGYKYVLVMKVDFSGCIELVPSAAADAATVSTALMDWFKRFGCVMQWVTDRGSHFRNQVIGSLRKALGGDHHFTTAYCPWANGTLEVVNRLLLRCMRVLLSEMKSSISQWPVVLPLVQSALNHMPADRLKGTAPVTAFTALPAVTPLSMIVNPITQAPMTAIEVSELQNQHIKSVQKALEAMHKELAGTAEGKRTNARKQRIKKKNLAMSNFDVGDYVLVAQVMPRANKLAVRWKGPKRVVQAISDFI